jgi:hypothetical protein
MLKPGAGLHRKKQLIFRRYIMEFSTIDWITLGLYFIILVALGIYFSFRQKSAAQYFLAGRNTRWYAIGTSIFVPTFPVNI